jgi:hypothetical protein
MPDDSLGRLVQSDQLLRNKIESLRDLNERTPLRYYELITRYVDSLPRENATFQKEMRYGTTLDAISQLWVTSEKNPSIFRDVKEFEPILMKIPNYRDHFVHSLNVFLLGYYLINRLKGADENLDFRSNDYNLTWMLASTFHDVGYAIEDMEYWLNEILKRFLGASPRFSFNIMEALPLIYVDFLRLISHWHTHSLLGATSRDSMGIEDWTFYDELSSKLVEKHHGVLSGLMLAHLLAVREGFTIDREYDFLYNHLPACHAICVHNLPSIPLDFDKHPIAFMLALCDELQDWGRPSAQNDQDVLYLNDIQVIGGPSPTVRFSIEVSETRKERLKEALSNLHTRGRIEVSIIDGRAQPVFDCFL